MAQTSGQTPAKKHRVQIKVFDVDSGQEVSSIEHIIPVNGNGGGGFSCSCTSCHCIMVAKPT
jgi:hypothetical protein